MDLKIFLPVEDYTLTTKLKVEEVSKRLSEKIRARRTIRGAFRDFLYGDDTRCSYEGYLVSNQFEMQRIIGYRNSFLPVINGLIYNMDGKTYIRVEMKIVDYVLIPVMIVIAVVLLASLFNLRGGFINRATPFLITLFAYSVFYFAFKIESNITTRFLKRLLEAEKIIP
jgi:hypothetical protein